MIFDPVPKELQLFRTLRTVLLNRLSHNFVYHAIFNLQKEALFIFKVDDRDILFELRM